MVDIMELPGRLNERLSRRAVCGRRTDCIDRGPLPAQSLRQLLAALFLTVAPTIAPTIAPAQDTPDYFRQNCMNCHTIGGGRLTGPDLKDVAQRRDTEWLIGRSEEHTSELQSH